CSRPLPRVLRLVPERAAADRRATGREGYVRPGGVPDRAARLARRGARGRARREAAAPGARRAERVARARVGGGAGGTDTAPAGRGARGAARGAEPGEPADPHRVLRRVDDPGRVVGRLAGRVPGRRAEEGALPQVRRALAGRAGRLRGDGGGRLAALRAARR